VNSTPTARATARTTALSLTIAGSASVAVAFGMARYGYGLLLPDIKRDLVIGEAKLGAIGTLAYVTYIAAALGVTPAVRRFGARPTVIGGGLLGIVGTTVIARSSGALALAVGVGTAGASAGLVYPPFAEALRALPEEIRGRAIASINCGTGWGVAVAAPIAIVAGSSWRLAYLGFAFCGLLSTFYAARVLPAAQQPAAEGQPARLARAELRPGTRRILAGALLIGLGSGLFWTFAVQDVRGAGLSVAAGRVLLGVAGVGSLVGVGAADLADRLGLRRTFFTCATLGAASTAALALLSSSEPSVVASAFAFGVSYNIAVAVSVLALIQLDPQRPAAAVALVAGANAAGLLFAPLAGGAISTQIGLTATLVGGAGILLAAMIGAPRGRRLRDRGQAVSSSGGSAFGPSG
jgi:predicted MFS family arabinose efflux permease